MGAAYSSHLDARWQGADSDFQSRQQTRLRRLLPHEGRARRAASTLLLRGNHVEGEADALARWRQARLQFLSRPAVATALGDATQRRRRLPTHLWRVRSHFPALVARWNAHRI